MSRRCRCMEVHHAHINICKVTKARQPKQSAQSGFQHTCTRHPCQCKAFVTKQIHANSLHASHVIGISQLASLVELLLAMPQHVLKAALALVRKVARPVGALIVCWHVEQFAQDIYRPRKSCQNLGFGSGSRHEHMADWCRSGLRTPGSTSQLWMRSGISSTRSWTSARPLEPRLCCRGWPLETWAPSTLPTVTSSALDECVASAFSAPSPFTGLQAFVKIPMNDQFLGALARWTTWFLSGNRGMFRGNVRMAVTSTHQKWLFLRWQFRCYSSCGLLQDDAEAPLFT